MGDSATCQRQDTVDEIGRCNLIVRNTQLKTVALQKTNRHTLGLSACHSRPTSVELVRKYHNSISMIYLAVQFKKVRKRYKSCVAHASAGQILTRWDRRQSRRLQRQEVGRASWARTGTPTPQLQHRQQPPSINHNHRLATSASAAGRPRRGTVSRPDSPSPGVTTRPGFGKPCPVSECFKAEWRFQTMKIAPVMCYRSAFHSVFSFTLADTLLAILGRLFKQLTF